MNQPTDRSAAHFWHIRQVDGDPTTPALIALPRDARTLELMGMPAVDFERAIIVTRTVNLPDAVVAALPGRLATDVVDHPIVQAGAIGAGAVITWAALDDFGLKLVLDRPVQPRAEIGGFDFLPPDQDIIDAGDAPGVLCVDGGDSLRDLTDVPDDAQTSLAGSEIMDVIDEFYPAQIELTDATALSLLGEVQCKLGELDFAQTTVKFATGTMGRVIAALVGEAQECEAAGDLERARRAYVHVHRLAPFGLIHHDFRASVEAMGGVIDDERDVVDADDDTPAGQDDDSWRDLTDDDIEAIRRA